MCLNRRLLLRSFRSAASATGGAVEPLPAALFCLSRPFAFASLEEAAAERRRRKRQLRIDPPLHRNPNASRPIRDPKSPRLPDSTSSLVGPRLSLHNRVQSLIRSGNLDDASAVSRQALFSSVRPTVFTCNSVMSSMLRARRFDDVSALFHFFFVQQKAIPSIVSYNVLINAHCDAGQIEKALDVYRQILATAPFTPSTVTYRHLTKGLVDSGRITEAAGLLREMLNRGHSTDALVYNNLIAGFINLDDINKALELLHELRERCFVYDGVVHVTVMEAYWKRGMDKEAMESYQSLMDRQFKMTPVTCNALLQTLLKHGKEVEAYKLFDQMLDEHKPPVFTALNTETYNVMVDHCFSLGKFSEAIEVFHTTGVKPLSLDQKCFVNIIGKLRENGLIEDAEKLFDEMLEKPVEPDASTYEFFIDVCFRDGRIEDALKYFNKIVSGGESIFRAAVSFCNKVLDELVKIGLLDQATSGISKMVGEGMKPNAASYEIVISALCKEGDLETGRALLEEMVRSGVSATNELRALLSNSFEMTGRAAEIESLLAEKTNDVPPHPVPGRLVGGGAAAQAMRANG
ncbi:Pentatricopeptide repeat-containing protein [Apostasia shenzhenica]|uniref:Pentatricopeptide repeat-containing protein n=1 Tax=Apostasia shenzhenica TaxID=1088818 RepID=A0A2I0AUV2_9ASPA|nr:Pentatricopeptide repeat-containing protein [Apostasia shenzhenica]